MDENTINLQDNSLKLEKAYTFFMVPFCYEGEWNDIHKRISRWEPIQEEMYKENILFPHIIELFKQANPKKDNSKRPDNKENDYPTNRLKIYQLHLDDKGNQSEFFFDRIVGKKQVAILEENPDGQKVPYALPFKVLNDGNNAPHLFISQSAQIGIMTICVELGDNQNIQDLELLNYCLHKRDETKDVEVGEKRLPDGKTKKIKDKRTQNYRIVCPFPEKNNSLSDTEIMGFVTQYLNSDGYKRLINEVQNINDEHINWDLNFFIGFLLNTLGRQSQVKYFNKERAHIYTFCSIDDSGSAGRGLTSEDIVPNALRLSRVVNKKYLLPFDEMLEKGAMLQTYQNIYFSSAIEGTSMICIEKDVNKSFIGNMQNRFNRQYLLVYLLVLLQRYTLLSIDRKLTEYDARNDDTDDGLWNLINLICKIKVNCYFTDVSIYTHHSQFYQHCCKNLHIPETFKEIDEKVELLKLTTDRRLQQLMKEQRDKQVEEAKKLEEERERQRLKEKEEERQRLIDKEDHQRMVNEAKDEAERRQHILNCVVAILTLAQVIQASYEVICHYGEDKMYYSLGFGALGVIVLVWLMWKDIKDFFSKLFK